MVPLLARAGYAVTGLDTGYFQEADLGGGAADAPVHVIAKDIRHIEPADLTGFDAVVHLAGLSNDALGELSQTVTYAINHEASVRLAELAKAAGVSRFVYASSCSVYGRSAASVVDETSPVDPQTDYARCKVLDEEAFAAMADETFSPTCLRNATAYGASPRMRFDLVANNLSGLAWTTKRIALLSDGTPWRPIVHVLDICKAFLAVLAAPRETVHKRVLNVGQDADNYQVREIAACVADVFPGCALSFGATDPDQRSYRVRFDELTRVLPHFRCDWTLRRGVVQLRELYERVELTEEMFRYRPYTRLAQLKHLIESGQIDSEFFWVAP
jgi:nucleoside-diphosphate-sugar epimerase